LCSLVENILGEVRLFSAPLLPRVRGNCPFLLPPTISYATVLSPLILKGKKWGIIIIGFVHGCPDRQLPNTTLQEYQGTEVILGRKSPAGNWPYCIMIHPLTPVRIWKDYLIMFD